MPLIYLSPSTQESNLFVSGGTEEEYMNRIADAMEPYLTASGMIHLGEPRRAIVGLRIEVQQRFYVRLRLVRIGV